MALSMPSMTLWNPGEDEIAISENINANSMRIELRVGISANSTYRYSFTGLTSLSLWMDYTDYDCGYYTGTCRTHKLPKATPRATTKP